ncbi:MAG: O-antigen ligase family protein [bacterium]
MKNKLSSTHRQINDQIVSKIYLAGFCLILALPLLSIPPTFDPPDWGKTIVFRTIVSLLALFLGYQILFKKIAVDFHFNWHKSTSWVIIAFIALFLAYGLSTALSVDIHNSLWGAPYRAGGMVNLFFLFIYTALAYLLISRTVFIKLFKVAVFAGLAVAIIGLCQRFGILKTIFQQTIINITSTIGGPNFLSLYLLILLFVAIYLFIRETKVRSRIIYGTIVAIFITTIFFCISQATYLGLAAGTVYLVLFFPKKNRWLSVARIAIMTVIVVVVSMTAYLKVNPANPLSKVALFSWHIDESRMSAWKVSIEAIKNRPLLGYGSENYAIAFNRYYDPKLPEIQMDPYYKSSWWDKPHNVFIEIAVNNGILGLIAYLSFFGLLIWKLIKVRFASNKADGNVGADPDTVLIGHFLVAIFVGYFTNLLFAFDTFSSSLLIFTLIAISFRIINSSNGGDKGDPVSCVNIKTGKPANADGKTKAIMIAFVIATGWFIYNGNLKPLIANREINVALELATRQSCSMAIESVNRSRQKTTIIDGYLKLVSAEALKCGLSSPSEPEYINRINQVVATLKESAEASPQNPKVWLYLAEFTTLLIDKENDPVIKGDLLDTVDSYLEKARTLSPKRQEIAIDWAKANIASGNYDEALNKAVICRDLNPNLGECYWLMAISQIYLGIDNAQITDNLQLAKDRDYDTELTQPLTVLVNAYIATDNFPALVEPFQKLIILNPENGDYHGQLAVVYKELGDYQKAKDEALILLNMSPETKSEVEEFIQSLPRQ